METLADLRRRGVQPDQKWAEKHGFALSKPKEKGGHFDSAGVYRPSEKEASSWVPDSEYEANEQRYNWRISDAKAKAIEDLVSLFPQDAQSDMRHRAVSALKLSETMGISFEEAFRDLDLYQTEMFPHIKSVETLGQTLDRSAKMAELSRAIAKETGAFRRLPIDEREKRKEAYKTWLDSANAELQKYADAIPANSLVKSLGDTVQSLALMREGLIAGGLAAVAGGIFNPIAGTVASTAITGAMNNELYTNLAYADMFAAGIDDLDIVEQNAGMTGSAQAMTEVLLGMLPMGSVSGVLLKGLAGKAAARFLGKKLTLEGAKSIGDLVKKSVWQQFWLGTAAKPLEIGLEGVEEALQAVEGNANFIKAAEAYEGLVKKNLREEFAQADRDPAFSGLDWSRVYAALEDPEESFKAGIAMALWMGVSFSALGTLPKTAHEVSVKMNLVRELVQTAPNREEAKEAVAEILGDNVSRETSDALVDKIYAETPELSFDEKDDEKPGSIRGMEFSEVIDNPNSADQKLAIFVERGRQNAVFDRTYIPFTVEENDEQYEVTPVVDIDADTAERLAQDTATWYQKETVVISPDGNRYACSPRSENSPGNAGIRQERSEAETLQSADPADPSQVTMDGTERVREQQQAGPTQSDTQPDTVDQGEHPADIDAVPGTSEAATREEPAQQTPSEAWVDLQTGLEVRISPQTGKPVIAVKRGQSLDLKDQGGILERYYQAQEKTQEASHAAQTQEAARPPEAADTGKEPHVGEQASYAPEIREKYESYPSISGNEDVIYVGGKQVHGVWKLVEAAAPSASHDEETFKKTPGFPLTAEQSTINDRDYEHDKDAQEFVITIAQDFNGQALDMGSPVVVTQDGVVISGNNRTMSSKRAANHNSDQEYIEVLKEYRASQYGFSEKDIEAFEHPRVVFEIPHNGLYTTDLFAAYNAPTEKQKAPFQKAIEMTKRITPEVIRQIAAGIGRFERLQDLYLNEGAMSEIWGVLVNNHLVSSFEMPNYYPTTPVGIKMVSDAGKEFFESIMLGSVLSEDNIRLLAYGGTGIRQKLVRAIVPLVENKDLGPDGISGEINNAIKIRMRAKISNNTLDDFVSQKDFQEQFSTVESGLAFKLDTDTTQFYQFMQTLIDALRLAASGAADMFSDNQSKERIVENYLSMDRSAFIKEEARVEYAISFIDSAKTIASVLDTKREQVLGKENFEIHVRYDNVLPYIKQWLKGGKSNEEAAIRLAALSDLLENGTKTSHDKQTIISNGALRVAVNKIQSRSASKHRYIQHISDGNLADTFKDTINRYKHTTEFAELVKQIEKIRTEIKNAKPALDVVQQAISMGRDRASVQPDAAVASLSALLIDGSSMLLMSDTSAAPRLAPESSDAAKRERVLEVFRNFLKLPDFMTYNIREDPDVPAGIRGMFDTLDKTIRVRDNRDVDAVVHEMLHQYYLTLTPAEIRAFNKMTGFNPGTRAGAEAWVDNALAYLGRHNPAEAESQSLARTMLREIADFLRNLWDALVEFVTNKPSMDAYFHKIFKGNTERKGYNAKLNEALNLNLQREIAKTVSVRGIQSALFTQARAQTGAQTVFINDKPLSEASLRDQIQAFQNAYAKQMAETAKQVEAINNIIPKEYNLKTGIDKKQTEMIFSSFDGTENCFGEKTRFPKSTVGKILRNKGFDVSSIIQHFGELYHNALPAYSEKERVQSTRPDGTEHKKHLNFLGYHNFVNKFKVGDEEYYIRFTVQEEVKSKKNPRLPNHIVHSSFVSDVFIYNQARGTLSGKSPAVTSSQIVDTKLQEFFNSVNTQSSVFDLFSRNDEGSLADQVAVLERTAGILGAWSAGSAFLSGNPVILADGRVIADEKIAEFITPAVQSGLITAADKSKIEPLYMRAILPEEVMDAEEAESWADIIENGVIQKSLFDAAFSACELFPFEKKKAFEQYIRSLGDTEKTEMIEEYFNAVYDNYRELARKRDADGMAENPGESAVADKISLAEWEELVKSEEGLTDIFQKVLAKEQELSGSEMSPAIKEQRKLLNRFIGKDSGLIRKAVNALKEGRTLQGSMKIMVRKRLTNRYKNDVYKNLYGVISGDQRYISGHSDMDAINDMLGRTALSAKELERLMLDADVSELIEHILETRLDGVSHDAMGKAEAQTSKTAEALEKNIENKQAGINEDPESLTKYQQRVIKAFREAAAGKDLKTEEFKAFKAALIRHIYTLREYEVLREKLTGDQVSALQDMTESILDLQNVRAQQRAVADLKRMTDKLYHSIFKKIPEDVSAPYAEAIKQVQTVLGNKTLRKYLGGLYASAFGLETMAEDYVREESYRAQIDAALDPGQRDRLRGLLYNLDGSPRAFTRLDPRELQSLGAIFAYNDKIQKLKIDSFLEKAQRDPALLAGVASIMTGAEYKRTRGLLFNKDGTPRELSKLGNKSKTYLVRRITGAPEWSENLEIQEADNEEREEAAQWIEESRLFTNEEKALLGLNADGRPAANPKCLADVSRIAAAVVRIKKAGQAEQRDFLEQQRFEHERIAEILGKKVPLWMGGKPLISYKEFRGEWEAGREYKSGELVTDGDHVYRAEADTGADLTDQNSWKLQFALNTGEGDWAQKLRSWWANRLKPTYMAELMFDEAGLAPERKASWRYIISGREAAYAHMQRMKYKRIGALFDKLKALKIHEREFAEQVFKVGDFGQAYRLDQAMYLWAANRNSLARNAVLGGIFLSSEERRDYNDAVSLDQREAIQNRAEKRYAGLLDQYTKFISEAGHKKYHDLLLYMVDELDQNYRRLKEFMAKYYNKELKYEDFYIPLIRISKESASVEENYETQVNNIALTANRSSLEKGMTIDRLELGLGHQSAINPNLFDVYSQHIHQAEKLMAYEPWVRRMKYIFEGSSDASRILQDKLNRAFGSGADEGSRYWRKILRDEINDGVYTSDSKMNQTLYALRGNVVKNSILLRLSTIVTQLVTSTPASMGLVKNSELLFDGIPILHNKTAMDAMLRLNPVMKERWRTEDIQFGIMPKIQDYEPGTGKGKHFGLKPLKRKLDEIGASALRFADRAAVAPLFHAVYMRELRKGIEDIRKKNPNTDITYNPDNPYELYGGEGAQAAQVRRRAIELANEVINNTQPTNDMFHKPLSIRDSRGLNGVITMFQTPLAILFNELTWGMPSRLKQDFSGNAFMVANGLLWLGGSMILMGFIRDEDKDDWKEAENETKIRRLLSYLFGSQGFFGSIPLFGTVLGGLIENMLRGEKKFQNFGNALAPAVDDVTRLMKHLSEDPEWGTIVVDMLKIGTMYYGTGQGLIKDVTAAWKMAEEKGLDRGFFRLFGVR